MKGICSSALGILTSALESSGILNEQVNSSYDTLLRSFWRLKKLQMEYAVFVSLDELNDKQLLQSMVEEIFSKKIDLEESCSHKSTIFKAKRLCNLFVTWSHESSSIFFLLIGEYIAKRLLQDDVDPFDLYLLLEDCGKDTDTEFTAPIIMHFAMSLCRSAALDTRQISKTASHGGAFPREEVSKYAHFISW